MRDARCAWCAAAQDSAAVGQCHRAGHRQAARQARRGSPALAARRTAVTRIPRPTGHRVRPAVPADRRVLVGRPLIRRVLGISGDAARARFTRRDTAGGRSGSGDAPPR